MATKLGLYNAALRELGEINLTTVTDATESRYVLDDVYDAVLADCLESGLWNFAIRAIKSDADTGIEPEFGPSEVHAKPSDFVRLAGMSADGDFSVPLGDYLVENENWVSYTSPVYIRYVSNGENFGLDLSNWPRSFTRYVELSLALRICERLTQNKSKAEQLRRDVKDAAQRARSIDAMDEAQPRYAPLGSWNSARRGYGGDRGSRNRLTG